MDDNFQTRKDLGIKIRMGRKEKGMSQQQLASKIIVSQSSVCKYEKGYMPPSIEVLYRIVKVLGIKIP